MYNAQLLLKKVQEIKIKSRNLVVVNSNNKDKGNAIENL